MEWVLGIIGFLLFCYLLGGNERKKTGRKISKSVTVKEFIEPGKVYTAEEAIQTVHRFVLALGDSEGYRWVDSAGELAQSFPRLLEQLKKEYREQLRECEQELNQTTEHYQKEIENVSGDSSLDEDDRKELLEELNSDYKDELRGPQKEKKWLEKQILSLDEDPTPILKKVLARLKSEHKEDNPPVELDDGHIYYDLLKTSPR